jgi:hypothetical protein
VSFKREFKDALVTPPFGIVPGPQARRLTSGNNLDGTFWLEIEGVPGRINLRPAEVEMISLAWLRALGHTIDEVPALAEVGVGRNN